MIFKWNGSIHLWSSNGSIQSVVEIIYEYRDWNKYYVPCLSLTTYEYSLRVSMIYDNMIFDNLQSIEIENKMTYDHVCECMLMMYWPTYVKMIMSWWWTFSMYRMIIYPWSQMTHGLPTIELQQSTMNPQVKWGIAMM